MRLSAPQPDIDRHIRCCRLLVLSIVPCSTLSATQWPPEQQHNHGVYLIALIAGLRQETWEQKPLQSAITTQPHKQHTGTNKRVTLIKDLLSKVCLGVTLRWLGKKRGTHQREAAGGPHGFALLFPHHVALQDDLSLCTVPNSSFLLFMMDEVHLHSSVLLKLFLC